MRSYSRFEMFLDVLWGAALLLALHLLPFSFHKASDWRSMLLSPSMAFHASILATFTYIFWLRVHRNLVLYRLSREEGQGSGE